MHLVWAPAIGCGGEPAIAFKIRNPVRMLEAEEPRLGRWLEGEEATTQTTSQLLNIAFLNSWSGLAAHCPESLPSPHHFGPVASSPGLCSAWPSDGSHSPLVSCW